MLTRKSLNDLLQQVTKELIQNGIAPSKIILFGSYAKGNVHAYSNIDTAVWSEKFTGNSMEDFDIIRQIAKKTSGYKF
jgi:predicted nucleotidyltransferase